MHLHLWVNSYCCNPSKKYVGLGHPQLIIYLQDTRCCTSTATRYKVLHKNCQSVTALFLLKGLQFHFRNQDTTLKCLHHAVAITLDAAYLYQSLLRWKTLQLCKRSAPRVQMQHTCRDYTCSFSLDQNRNIWNDGIRYSWGLYIMLIIKGTCHVTRPSNAWQPASTGTIAQLPMAKSNVSMLRHEKQRQKADQEWPFKHHGHTAASQCVNISTCI